MLASILELTLSDGIWCIDEVQFMTDFRALEQFTKPCTLRLCVAWKIEDNGNAFRQESTNVWRESLFQPRRALNESRYVHNLAGIQSVQEFILH